VEIRIPRGSNELQQVPKLLKCQPGIARDACHRDCIGRIVPRDDQYSATVAQDQVRHAGQLRLGTALERNGSVRQ
jgi:hypothetical protein